MNAKSPNPKDLLACEKVPFDLVPTSAVAELATAMAEGALKYGRYNWRVMDVRASVYLAAAYRHLGKYLNGDNYDNETYVNHLASVMACCAIIIDASVCGTLIDDRPPAAPESKHIDGLSKSIQYLREIFKDKSPRQYTISDTKLTDTEKK